MSSAAVVIGTLRVNINSWGMGLRVLLGGGGGQKCSRENVKAGSNSFCHLFQLSLKGEEVC